MFNNTGHQEAGQIIQATLGGGRGGRSQKWGGQGGLFIIFHLKFNLRPSVSLGESHLVFRRSEAGGGA